MVNKPEKPTEIKLARGPILASELAQLLIGARDTARQRHTYIAIHWKDGHRATLSDLDSLEPIEDAQNIEYVYGSFDYDDGSELVVQVGQVPTVAASGQIARQKQTAMVQQWATFPRRGRLSHRAIGVTLWLATWPVLGTFALLVMLSFDARLRTSPQAWMLYLGLFVLSVCVLLVVCSTPSIRSISNVVVIHRPSSRPLTDLGTMAAALVGALALVVSMFAYLYPKK